MPILPFGRPPGWGPTLEGRHAFVADPKRVTTADVVSRGTAAITEADDTMAATGTVGGGSTREWLEEETHAQLCYVLVFEGLNFAICTWDPTGIAAAWAGTDWTTFYSGLYFAAAGDGGETIERIEPFDCSVRPTSLSFRIQDGPEGHVIAQLLKEADSAAKETEFTADSDADDATWTVLDTSQFPASGTLYAGLEVATYNAKTATTFTGLTRGKWALFGTNTAPLRFGHTHRLDTDGSNFRPKIRTSPVTHLNRRVALYVHHFRSGAWETKTEAELLWVGRIKGGPEDPGTGIIEIECASVHEELDVTLLENRYEGFLREGAYIREDMNTFGFYARRIRSGVGMLEWPPSGDVEYASPFTTGALMTHAEVASAINEQLQTWRNLGTILVGAADFMTLSLSSDPDDPFLYTWTATLGTSAAAGDDWEIKVYLPFDLLRLLGWINVADGTVNPSGHQVGILQLSKSTTTVFKLGAEEAPQKAVIDFSTGYGALDGRIELTDTRGTFAVQPSRGIPPTMPSATEGFFKIGDVGIVSVESTGTDEFRVLSEVSSRLTALGTAGEVRTSSFNTFAWPDGRDAEPIKVEQIWLEVSDEGAGELFLRLLTSTGTAGYNHATKDDHPVDCCVGIPWQLINADSIMNLTPAGDPYVLFLEKPRKFLELFDGLLNYTNQVLVFLDGKLTCVPVGGEAPAGAAEFDLTEANKAAPVDQADDTGELDQFFITTTKRSASTIINRARLDYHQIMGGNFLRHEEANSKVSQSDHRQAKPITLKMSGIYDNIFDLGGTAKTWRARVAATSLAYFSRPVAVLRRTFNLSLFAKLYPGARGVITDSRVVNPKTGTRGVTQLPVWVLERRVRWGEGYGIVELAFLPHLDPARIALWAPTAQIDTDYNANSYSRGYLAVSTSIILKNHVYTHVTQDPDGSWFHEGAKVHVVQLGAPTPTEWFTTIDAVEELDGKIVLVLTDPLAGWPGSGEFVIEFDDILTVTATQIADHAFIADDADNSTGKAANDAYIQGGEVAALESFFSSAPDFTSVWRKRRADLDDKGAPFSVGPYHDLAANLNNFLLFPTAPHLINESWPAVDHVPSMGSARRLVYGPVRVEIPRGGLCALKWKWRGKVTAGIATLRLVTSIGMVSGTSETATVYPDGGTHYAELQIAATTEGFSTEGILSGPAVVPGNPPYCYVTAELSMSDEVNTAYFMGLSVAEASV